MSPARKSSIPKNMLFFLDIVVYKNGVCLVGVILTGGSPVENLKAFFLFGYCYK
ncbi:hypothetical protein BT96DRAFT_90485 [Gymnopus androsaceus JB14]|uniref:Uncharacterized protein n=1 Tax=Gymnopus androsaceus JB14 TaxID=1447944 RepID=A0A6A4HER8_9AGAR|nr:hypothetical protein BT96DRAFT_90485 [Gymnopus androsaceus JB14]